MAPALSKQRWILVGLIGSALLAILLFTVQRMLVFPTSVTSPDVDAGTGVPGLQRMWLQIDGGRVEAWLVPGDGVDADHPGPLVVYAHGNGVVIDPMPAALEHYRRRGMSVLLPEYRGYGRSAGSPSESAIAADFVAFYDLVTARPEVDRNRIVLHGRSLGGGVVGGLAKERPCAAIIIESTFTSLRALAWEKWYVPPFLILDNFDTLAAAEGFPGPMLIVHGRNDTLTPLAHGEALHEAAARSKLVVHDGAHNDAAPNLWGEIDAFLLEAGVTH